MSIRKSNIYIVLSVILLTVAVLTVIIFYNKYHITYQGALSLNVSESVTVRRNTAGVPHIAAGSVSDLYRTLGFLHAQDRLSSMIYYKNICDGNIDRIVSDPEEREIFSNLIKLLEIPEKSSKIFSSLDHKDQQLLIAYSEGVNSILSAVKSSDGKKYVWSIDDSIRIMILLEFSSTYLKNRELFFPTDRKSYSNALKIIPSSFIYRYDESESHIVNMLSVYKNLLSMYVGSYNRGYTYYGLNVKTGGIVEGYSLESHPGLPQLWYPFSAEMNGHKITGTSLCSMPFILHGRNDGCSFSVFDAMFDSDSFVKYRLRKNDTVYQYLSSTGWTDFTEKASNDKIFRFTENGMVISHFTEVIDDDFVVCIGKDQFDKNYVSLLLNFPFLEPSAVISDSRYNVDCKKIIMCTENNINCFYIGSVDSSLRRDSVLIPYLPHVDNSSKKAVYGIDEKRPFFIFGTDGSTDDIRYGSLSFMNTLRFERISELLAAKNNSGMERSVMDIDAEFYKKFYDVISRRLDKIPLTSAKLSALYLSGWNGINGSGEVSPSIIQYLYLNLLYQTIKDDFTEQEFRNILQNYFLVSQNYLKMVDAGLSDLFDDKDTPEKYEDLDAIIDRTFLVTMRMMHRNYGPYMGKWQYKKISSFEYTYPDLIDRIQSKSFQYSEGDAYSPVKTLLQFDYINEKLLVSDVTSLMTYSEGEGDDQIGLNFGVTLNIFSKYRKSSGFVLMEFPSAAEIGETLMIHPLRR